MAHATKGVNGKELFIEPFLGGLYLCINTEDKNGHLGISIPMHHLDGMIEQLIDIKEAHDAKET